MHCCATDRSATSWQSNVKNGKALRGVLLAGVGALMICSLLLFASFQCGGCSMMSCNGQQHSTLLSEPNSLAEKDPARTEVQNVFRKPTDAQCNIPRGPGVMPNYPATTSCRIRNLVLKNGKFYFTESFPPKQGPQLDILKRELVDVSPTPISGNERCTDVIDSPTIIHHCVLNFQSMYHVFLQESMPLYFTSRVEFGRFPEDLQVVIMQSHFGPVTPCTYEFATGGGILSVAYPLVTLLSSRPPIWREQTSGKTICFKNVVTGIERAFDPIRISYGYRGAPAVVPKIPGTTLNQVEMVNEVVSRLLKNAGVRASTKKGPQIMYQHRRETSSPHEKRPASERRLVAKNDLAIMTKAIKEECAKFQDCTFVFVDAFDLTFAEQLRIATSSNILIGPMGAGMTHLVFLRQPSATIVLDDPHTNSGAPERDIIPLLAFLGRHRERLETGRNAEGKIILKQPNGEKNLRSALRRALLRVGGVCVRGGAGCAPDDGGRAEDGFR